MQKRKFDELVSYFNKKVSEMEIETKYKMELLGMVTALGYANEKETHEERTKTRACDLISRQSVLKAIDEYERLSAVSQTVRNMTSLQEIVQWLPSAQSEPHWIPCSERLPEEKDAGILKKLGINKRSDYVIATVEVKGERMTVTACTYDGAWDWNMKYAFPDYKVVA